VVGKAHTGNGITQCEKGTYALVGGEEVYCCAEAFGYAHRSRHRTPISDSEKVRVLTRARDRCECCGAHGHQRALEVDHIVPRNQSGSDDLSNLQAMCFRCNAGKHRQARGGLCVLRAGGQRPGADQGHSMESPSPSGGLGSLSTSETQCLAVASDRTAIRS